MARNYTIGEAVQILNDGTDAELVQDISRRYPLLAHKASVVAAKAGEDFVDLMQYIPEYVSANKVNSKLKKALLGDGETADDEPKAKPKKEEKPKKEDKKAKKSSVYDGIKGKELNELIDQVNGRKKCQKEFGDCKNGSMKAYLEKYYPDGVDAADDDEDAEESYQDMSEEELFKLCKSRGIKAPKGKKAKFYIQLLEEADANEGDADEDEDDDDGWDVPKKEEKPAKGKGKKKAEPEPEEDDDEEEDDDDDWDI